MSDSKKVPEEDAVVELGLCRLFNPPYSDSPIPNGLMTNSQLCEDVSQFQKYHEVIEKFISPVNFLIN